MNRSQLPQRSELKKEKLGKHLVRMAYNKLTAVHKNLATQMN